MPNGNLVMQVSGYARNPGIHIVQVKGGIISAIHGPRPKESSKECEIGVRKMAKNAYDRVAVTNLLGMGSRTLEIR